MSSIIRRPSLLTFGVVASLLAMVILAATTNPIDNVNYGLVFFGLMAVFLVSAGYLLTRMRWGKVTTKSRSRIFIASSVILIGLMLRSSDSLDWIEALVLLIIGVGLWLYSGRRA